MTSAFYFGIHIDACSFVKRFSMAESRKVRLGTTKQLDIM